VHLPGNLPSTSLTILTLPVRPWFLIDDLNSSRFSNALYFHNTEFLKCPGEHSADIIRVLHRIHRVKVYGILWNGDIASYIVTRECPNKITNIDYFAVLPNFQNKGLGTIYMNLFVLANSGLLSLECRPRLCKFYQRFGFKEYFYSDYVVMATRSIKNIGKFLSQEYTVDLIIFKKYQCTFLKNVVLE